MKREIAYPSIEASATMPTALKRNIDPMRRGGSAIPLITDAMENKTAEVKRTIMGLDQDFSSCVFSKNVFG